MTTLSPTLQPRDIAAELLHSYWDALYYHDVAATHEEVETPAAFQLFEMVFDLMGVPSRNDLMRMRIPKQGSTTDYWSRDDLIKEFHRLYEDPHIQDEKIIDLYLDLLGSFDPKGVGTGTSNPVAQA